MKENRAAYELKTIMDEMESGVTDFTVQGECSNCGACCGNYLPISDLEIKRIHRYLKDHPVQEQKQFLPTAKPYTDLTCPFRSQEEQKCLIYKVRPAICKDFRCDKPRKQIAADKALYHGKYMVCDMRNG